MQILMMPDYRRDNPYQQLLADALSETGIEVRFPAGYRRVFPLWRELAGRQRTDVLHLHWQDAYIRRPSGPGALVYAAKLLVDLCLVKMSGCRLVWTVHNEVPHEASWPALHRALQRMVAALADAVIFHSQSACAKLQPVLRVDPDKSHVIAHGSYRTHYGAPVPKAQARLSLGLPETAPVYLHLGMLRPYKGVENLLAAWSSLQSELGMARLIIAGRPYNDEYGQRLANLVSECPGVILQPSYVASEQIRLYLSAADYVVLPFRRILTSGSLLLALSYDVPVIAPSLPAISEIILDKDSCLYDPQQPDGLRDVLRSSLGARPTPGATSGISHDWAPIAEATAACYGYTIGLSAYWPTR